jgi:hypothetical protein
MTEDGVEHLYPERTTRTSRNAVVAECARHAGR